MSARGKVCPDCGGEIVWVHAANGGRFTVEPYPDLEGKIRVDVLGRDLVVLAADAPSSAQTRRYEKHQCPPAGLRRPELRPRQLTLDGAS